MKLLELSPMPKTGLAEAALQKLSPLEALKKAPPPPSANPHKRRRAAAYLRYSTDGQDPFSFDRQHQTARDYAESIGADIILIFGDPGESGAYTANRPGFTDMLEAAKAGQFDCLIIEEGDRLSRRLHITTAAYHTLVEHNVELHSSKLGRWSLIHAAFSGLMSEEARTRISEVMRAGIVKIVGRGLWPSRAPFGYKKVVGTPGEMTVDQEEAEIVKRIFRLRSEGLNVFQIARLFNETDVKRPNELWYGVTVKNILANPIYIGVLLYFRTRQKRVEREGKLLATRTPTPTTVWQYAERPDWAIVTIEEWQQVQLLQAAKREYGPMPKFLLSKVVYCGRCGQRMHAEGRHKDRAWMRCSGRWLLKHKHKHKKTKLEKCHEPGVLLDSLEDHIIRFVCTKLDAPEALSEMQRAYELKAAEQANQLNRERDRLEKEKNRVAAQLDASFEAAMVIGLTTDFVAGKRAKLCGQMEKIDRDLAMVPRVVVRKQKYLDAPLDAASFLSELTPMRNYRNCGEPEGKMFAIIRKLVEKVVVSSDPVSKLVRVEVFGPIAQVGGSGSRTFTIVPETRNAQRIRAANKSASAREFALTDEDWAKIESKLPAEAIWIEEFDTPLSFRDVLDAVLLLKRTNIGVGNLPDTYGPKRQVWGAIRMLNYAGVLDLAQEVMARERIATAKGLILSIDSKRSVRSDCVARYRDWNERRQLRVTERLRAH